MAEQIEDEYLSRKALQNYMHTQEKGIHGENVKGQHEHLDKQRREQHSLTRNEDDQDDLENMLQLDDNDPDQEEEEEEDDNDDDDDNDNENDESDTHISGRLLESLTTDIEKYHKKVQLKKKFERPVSDTLEKEHKIARELKKDKPREISTEKFEEDAVENDSKRQKTSSTRKALSWTKAEDDAIVYYKEEMKYSWRKIEELLEKKHSWQAIQMRYLRNHKSRNDEWSRFMEIKLINLIRKDWENRWKRIGADLGRDFSAERCITKNIEICKKMELPYYSNVFKNKEIAAGYKNQFNDIKDAEAHKKLMLVYMGLDSISYEDNDVDLGGTTGEAVDEKEHEVITGKATTTTAEAATSAPIPEEGSMSQFNSKETTTTNGDIDTSNLDPAIMES